MIGHNLASDLLVKKLTEVKLSNCKVNLGSKVK